MWIIDLLVNLPSPHPEALTHPSTLEVLRAKEHAPTPSLSVLFIFGFVIKSIKELGGALVVTYLCSKFYIFDKPVLEEYVFQVERSL
jgi:hypothetical protein